MPTPSTSRSNLSKNKGQQLSSRTVHELNSTPVWEPRRSHWCRSKVRNPGGLAGRDQYQRPETATEIRAFDGVSLRGETRW